MKEEIIWSKNIGITNNIKFFNKEKIKKYILNILSFLDDGFNGNKLEKVSEHRNVLEFLMWSSISIDIDTLAKAIKEQRELDPSSDKKIDLSHRHKSYTYWKEWELQVEEYIEIYDKYNKILSNNILSDRDKIIELEIIDKLIVSATWLRWALASGSESSKEKRKIFFSDETNRDVIFSKLDLMPWFKWKIEKEEWIINNKKEYIIKRKDESFKIQKEKDKDKYSLAPSTREHHLDIIFWDKKVSDWTFLYERDKKDKDWKDNWYTKFINLSLSEEYSKYIGQSDKETLSSMSKYLKSIKDYWIKNHIELWPWDAEKIFKIYKWMHARLNWTIYKPLDASGVWMDIVKNNIKKKEHKLGIKFKKINWDVSYFDESDIYDTSKDQMYYFLWWSIGNFDYDNIVELLWKLKSNQILRKTPSLVTYFLAPDKKSEDFEQKKNELLSAYWNKEAEDSILSWFEALGIDRNSLKYTVEYDEDSKPLPMIKMWAIITEDIVVEVKWKKREKKKWEKIRAIKSQRFTKDQFEEITSKTGHTIRHTEYSWWVALALIENRKIKSLLKEKKHKQHRLGTGFAAIILASLVSWPVVSDMRERHKFKQEKLSEIRIYSYKKTNNGIFEADYIKNTKEKENILEKQLDQMKSILVTIYPHLLDIDDIEEKMENYIYQPKDAVSYDKYGAAEIEYFKDSDKNSEEFNLVNNIYNTETFISRNRNIFNDEPRYPHLRKYEEEMFNALEKGEDIFYINDKDFTWYYSSEWVKEWWFSKDSVDIRDYFLQTRGDSEELKTIIDRFKVIFDFTNFVNINKSDSYRLYRLLLKDIILNRNHIYQIADNIGDWGTYYITNYYLDLFTKKYNLNHYNQYYKYIKYKDAFENTYKLDIDKDTLLHKDDLTYIWTYSDVGTLKIDKLNLYINKGADNKSYLFAESDKSNWYCSLLRWKEITEDCLSRRNLNILKQ